jgi:hypothetical protein
VSIDRSSFIFVCICTIMSDSSTSGSLVVKPPSSLAVLADHAGPVVFLAGSIEMGKAIDWQLVVTRELLQLPVSVAVLNPRRDEWDSSWEQSITNPDFRHQVEWELDALERADLILMYLAPQTQSPISLLELGLFARSKKLLVACPPGFWRRGNVEVVCHRFGITLLNSLEELIASARSWVSSRTAAT